MMENDVPDIPQFHREYNYFYTFIKYTRPKTSHDPKINFIQLNKEILKLVDIVVSKEYDVDGRRFQSAYIIALTIDLCMDLEDIHPLMNSEIISSCKFRSIKSSLANLITAITNIFSSYLNMIMNVWNYENDKIILQNNMWQFTTYLFQLTEFDNVHELLSLTIELYSNNHILNERYEVLTEQPHMKYSYEINSVLPLEYYWNPKSQKLRYILTSKNMIMGKAYGLPQMLKIFCHAIVNKIDVEGNPEKEIKLMLSNIFQLRETDFNIQDKKTLLWPLMTHIYTKSYEENWNTKHMQTAIPKNTLKIKDLKEKKKEEIAAYEYKEWEQSIGLDFVEANGPGF